MERMKELKNESDRKKLEALLKKYHTNDNGETWYCNKCNSEIQAIEQTQSLHLSGSLAGFGETRREMIPYCPKCESKPSSQGFANYGDDPYRDLF